MSIEQRFGGGGKGLLADVVHQTPIGFAFALKIVRLSGFYKELIQNLAGTGMPVYPVKHPAFAGLQRQLKVLKRCRRLIAADLIGKIQRLV